MEALARTILFSCPASIRDIHPGHPTTGRPRPPPASINFHHPRPIHVHLPKKSVRTQRIRVHWKNPSALLEALIPNFVHTPRIVRVRSKNLSALEALIPNFVGTTSCTKFSSAWKHCLARTILFSCPASIRVPHPSGTSNDRAPSLPPRRPSTSIIYDPCASAKQKKKPSTLQE